MKLKQNVYFVGAGGIGMANLVRYCLALGKKVAGYDRTTSELSQQLETEGAILTYTDNTSNIPAYMLNPDTTLVVYTPAVPESNKILSYFRQNGFEVMKRAALLGLITRHSLGICVAGSHGKTSTCSMLANIMRLSRKGCTAFLGGVLRNTGSNLVLQPESKYSVIEADEYDRSFHHLHPHTAVITSTDPDHLDIYGDAMHYVEAFEIFTSLIQPGGHLLMHSGLTLKPRCNNNVTIHTYSGKGDTQADWYADNIRYCGDRLTFDLHGPDTLLPDIELGTPIEINIDNAVAAAAAALQEGVETEAVRNGLKTFTGAKRRFEFHLRPGQGRAILIDDYAHSPNEINASIASVRRLFPDRHLTVIFQPHLYTRTRDFAPDFAKALSAADRVVMPEIYPAREEPIPGVDSELILRQTKCGEKIFCPRTDLVNWVKNSNFDVLMTLGAADLDRLLPDITEALRKKMNRKVRNTWLKWTLLAALLVYAVTMTVWASGRADARPCTGVQVEVSGVRPQIAATVRQGVAEHLERLVHVQGTPVGKLNLMQIQKWISALNNLEDAQCAFSPDGKLVIRATALVPEMRIFGPGGESYYVNRQGKKMQARQEFFVDVPIVSGRFNKNFTEAGLVPLVHRLNADPVLTAMITMIEVRSASDIRLIPRVQGHTVVLGDTSRIGNKLAALKAFYSNVMPVRGWQTFERLNLAFAGRVVATLRVKPSAPVTETNTEPDVEEQALQQTVLTPPTDPAPLSYTNN